MFIPWFVIAGFIAYWLCLESPCSHTSRETYNDYDFDYDHDDYP